MSLFQVNLFEDGQLIDVQFADTFIEAVSIRIAHTGATIEELTCTACGGENLTVGQGDGYRDAIVECADCDNCKYITGPERPELTINEDWLGWADAPGGADYEPYSEDVDFAQAQMVAECAEASWHRFVVAQV